MPTSSIDLCLRALRLCHTGDWAAADVSAALRALYVDLEGDAAADAADRARHLPKDYQAVLAWKDRLVRCLAQAQLPIEAWWTWVSKVEDPAIRKHLILEIVRRLAAEEKLDLCRAYIERLPDVEIGARTESTRANGFLVLLHHHAERGDAGAFEAILPSCEPARNRGEITGARQRLVAGVAAARGWEAALALTRKRSADASFAFDALAGLAASMPYPDLRRLLDAHTELSGPPFHTRQRILVEAFRAQSGGDIDGGVFDELYREVDAIDPTLKFGDGRLRDWLLMNLGSGCLDLQQARRCQKAIRGQTLKRELGYHVARLTRGRP